MIMRYLFQRLPNAVLALALIGGAGFISGCGSTEESSGSSTPKAATGPASRVPALPPGVTLLSEGNVQGYWMAEGFKLKNYDSLQIKPTVFAGVERDNEVQIRAMAMRVLPEEIALKLRESNILTNIYVPGQEPKAGGKMLVLDNTITEYEQGGNVGRVFGGVFGAGQPVIKVRGILRDGEKVVFVYELRRSGESDEDKFLGGGKSSEEIQQNDIKVLARDLVQLLQRKAGF